MSARVVTELLREHFQTARQGSKTRLVVGQRSRRLLGLKYGLRCVFSAGLGPLRGCQCLCLMSSASPRGGRFGGLKLLSTSHASSSCFCRFFPSPFPFSLFTPGALKVAAFVPHSHHDTCSWRCWPTRFPSSLWQAGGQVSSRLCQDCPCNSRKRDRATP